MVFKLLRKEIDLKTSPLHMYNWRRVAETILSLAILTSMSVV